MTTFNLNIYATLWCLYFSGRLPYGSLRITMIMIMLSHSIFIGLYLLQVNECMNISCSIWLAFFGRKCDVMTKGGSNCFNMGIMDINDFVDQWPCRHRNSTCRECHGYLCRFAFMCHRNDSVLKLSI